MTILYYSYHIFLVTVFSLGNQSLETPACSTFAHPY